MYKLTPLGVCAQYPHVCQMTKYCMITGQPTKPGVGAAFIEWNVTIYWIVIKQNA